MTKREAERFRKLVAYCKARQPFRRRLIVKLASLAKSDGSTSISDNYRTVTITIAKSLNFAQAKDALIHEWGHAVEFDDWEPHGEQWGKNTAPAYQAWEEFLEEGE